MEKWYRFNKPGVSYGYGHFAGDVVKLDLPSEQERHMMTDGVIVPATGAEIEAAEALLAQEVAEGPALARAAIVPPSVVPESVQRQIDELFARVSTLEAQMQKPGKKE